MRKGNLGRLLLCCLFMLLFCAGCKNDKEKELREIENKGGSAELRTQYSKDGNVEKYTIEDSYWEGHEYEYDEKGRVVKCIDYDKLHDSTGYIIYEYR